MMSSVDLKASKTSKIEAYLFGIKDFCPTINKELLLKCLSLFAKTTIQITEDDKK